MKRNEIHRLLPTYNCFAPNRSLLVWPRRITFYTGVTEDKAATPFFFSVFSPKERHFPESLNKRSVVSDAVSSRGN